MNVIYKSSSAVVTDPEVLRAIKKGDVILLRDVGYTMAPTSTWGAAFAAEDDDEAADMVSLRKDRTGIDNTIFVSTKGRAQHAARIKIAVDPPDTLNASAATASMAIHDYGITGENVPLRVVEQAKDFIERNRDALLDYWNCKIDTAELFSRLKRPGA
jgi:hypothetical protein